MKNCIWFVDTDLEKNLICVTWWLILGNFSLECEHSCQSTTTLWTVNSDSVSVMVYTATHATI